MYVCVCVCVCVYKYLTGQTKSTYVSPFRIIKMKLHPDDPER